MTGAVGGGARQGIGGDPGAQVAAMKMGVLGDPAMDLDSADDEEEKGIRPDGDGRPRERSWMWGAAT